MTRETRQIFGSKAGAYSARPAWPLAAFITMLGSAGFNPLDEQALHDLVAIDVGAGTGDTTFPMADLGCTVIAVEPNRDMREQLERRRDAEGYRNVVVTAGDALDLKVPEELQKQAQLVYSGNAAHWWGSVLHHDNTGREKKAARAWASVAAPGAKAAIMFMNAQESDGAVAQLRSLVEKHFGAVSHIPKKDFEQSISSPAAFRDYFNQRSKNTDGSFNYKFRDFDHFKQWMLSFSYIPDNAFNDPAVEQEFRQFYDTTLHGDGQAALKHKISIYAGQLRC
jgi:SAM-dependent methyltransferase